MDIHITNLTKTFGRGSHALDHLTLTIPTGMFGLLGANGAGKTTLMRVLAGVLRPTGGQVHIGGHDITARTGRTQIQRVLGYLPQDFGVYPDLTAREFLDYIGLLKGLDHRIQRRRRVTELLDIVALTPHADRKLKTYSGGMRRRVGIAQALLAQPRLLIVDEPTSGLDPEERIRFRTLLAQLAGDRTVILSTHIVDDIAQTCHDIAVLAHGRLVFRGTTDRLTAQATTHVWTMETSGPAPQDAIVVSALPRPGGMRYRLITDTPPAGAEPATPTLEDGYLALARSRASTTMA